MDVLKIADQLRQEADALLNNDLLWQPFSSTGIIHLAGSTYLDLLVFPDLDVYYETKNPDHLISTFADATRNLIRCEDVTSIECEKDMHKRYPKQVPKGIFLQYRFNNGMRLWKVDIWAVEDKRVLIEKMQESKKFKETMTPQQRKTILLSKHKLAAPFGRTPVGSSYLVYKAVLEEGLNDIEEILAYIRKHGGNVDRLK